MVTKHIKCAHGLVISECRDHWIEFCEITGNTVEERALRWALGNDTGTSSKTLCCFMLGIEQQDHASAPTNADDRGRCIRLLKLIPEWLPLLPDLAKAEFDDPMSIDDINGHKYGWRVQIPLILQEGGF